MKTVTVYLLLLTLAGCAKTVTTEAPRERRDRDTEADTRVQTKSGVMSRAEFRKAVEGKTPKEVIAAIGKPGMTTDAPDNLDDPKYSGRWNYYSRVIDPATDKPDLLTCIVFKDGKVIEVKF